MLRLTVLLFVSSCVQAEAETQQQAQQSPPAEIVDAPFEVSDSAEGLLLTWYDDEGPHRAESRDEIPEESRENVRVDSLQLPPDERDPDAVFVADLRSAGQGGDYPVRRFTRIAFDALLDEATEPVEVAVAASDVIIYGASWCGACRSAARYFTRRGVAFEEKDIEREPGAREEMQRKARAAGLRPSGIPVIDFRGTILTGFNQRRIDDLIGNSPSQTL